MDEIEALIVEPMPLEEAISAAVVAGMDAEVARYLLLEKIRNGKLAGYSVQGVPHVARWSRNYGENANS